MSWQKVKISEVYEGLYDGPHATPPDSYEGAVFLGISNITKNGHIDLSNIKHINEKDLPKWTKRVTPKTGDIVFSYEATLNLYAIIPEGFWGCLGRRMALIRPDETKAHGKYLYYYFFSEEWRATVAQNTITGATVDRIPIAKFPDFPITLPSLDKQHKIAEILSAYDNLIENNQKQIKLLEEIAQRLYKEWFIDLHFPGYEVVPIIDGVPDGWKKDKAENFFDITIGKTPPRAEKKWFVDSLAGVKWASISDMGNEGTYLFSTNEGVTEEAIKKFNMKVIPAGTILVSFKLTVGRVSIAMERMCTNEAIAHFHIDDECIQAYIYCYLKNFEYDTLGNTSSISKAVNSKIIKAMPIIMPDIEVINTFSLRAKPVLEAIKVKQVAIFNLIEARNRLLPKLMSEEIEI